MRCPDCSKFVSIEMADPELDISLEDDYVSGTVRLVQSCADCGTELAEANLDINIPYKTVEFKHTKEGCRGELELSDEEAENDDRYEGSGRYAKHFYLANIRAKITCAECDGELEVETTVEEQASYFDSLV